MAEFELTEEELKFRLLEILFMIRRKNPIRGASSELLADILGVEPNRTHIEMMQLFGEQLVTRHPLDSSDFVLTDAGLAQIIEMREKYYGPLLEKADGMCGL